ncbi:MAG: helix-hairpin-helix domain-containing protein [Cytophagaceae bacterium]|nr:helix-hairpin-helix domain-containing protein [Cytophagaceae bacterium]
MKKIKYLLRNHFGFSKKETNGFIVLLILMILFLIFPWIFNQFYNPQKSDQAFTYRRLDSLIAGGEDPGRFSTREVRASLQVFLFDPNTASESDLIKIMGGRIGKRIANFRSKGGKFFIKSDLLKIYGMDKSLYRSIENYITLPDSISKQKINKQSLAKIIFDINKADSAQLESVKGIGKKLASRIVKYRDKVGGFISKDQYAEVYGLDSMVVAELKQCSFISEDFIPEKININSCTINALSSHPYIGKKNAASIIAYRNQHGSFAELGDLKKIKAIPENSLQKMLPYLSLD